MDRYDAARRRQVRPARSALGYWVPLVVTVTIATAGLAAWIWSERQQDDYDDDHDRHDDKRNDRHYPTDDRDRPPPPPGSFDAPSPAYPSSESRAAENQQGFLARMTGRTPSPQQFFDNAGQRIAASVAAAGAAVGLSGAARQDDREAAFSDHERWNEEAESKRSRVASSYATNNKSRKTVAVIVSAHSSTDDHQYGQESAYRTEHASILSHLPHRFDPATTRLFVLIYAPGLSALPSTNAPLAASSNLSSSYSAISNPANQSSGSSSPVMVPASPGASSSNNPIFDALWTQSLALVDKPSMILPFSTQTGYVHILRHLAPSLVYLADTPELSGSKGDHVAQLKGWVGQTILVVGDDGHGGLADTETEDEGHGSGPMAQADRWWENSPMIGLGKDVEVVDADRVGDDWQRRLVE